MDANNKILQSSGFDIAWNSSNESMATVEASGIPVPGGIALLPGASQVTGVATGQASITAEEQTSGKSGSSQVTVTPQLVSVYGFLFFANGVGTLQLTVNGQALGTDNNISTDPLDAFQICDVPVGSELDFAFSSTGMADLTFQLENVSSTTISTLIEPSSPSLGANSGTFTVTATCVASQACYIMPPTYYTYVPCTISLQPNAVTARKTP